MASFRIKGKVEGLKEAVAALDGVAKKVRTKLLKKAMTAGARPVIAAVRARTPRDSGALAMSEGTKVVQYPSGVAVAIVGPRTGFKTTGRGRTRRRTQTALGAKLAALGKGPAYYAHLVELGTRAHALGKGSRLRDRYKFDRKTRQRELVATANQTGRGHPGTAAQRFLRGGWEAAKTAAAQKAIAVIRDGLANIKAA